MNLNSALKYQKIQLLLAACIPEISNAKCKFDAESGVFYDNPVVAIILGFALMGLLFRTLLKEWSNDHPLFAGVLFFIIPVIVGTLDSGSC